MMLRADPNELASRFAGAEPFPHIVVDGLFDPEVLEEVVRDFPGTQDLEWVRFDSPTEQKLGFHHRSETVLARSLRDILYFMNSPTMLGFLEALTGISGLIPDPYFGGGGIHQIPRGGFLKIHADFNWHPLLRIDRRLNVLVYLNEGWEEEWGGHLELWDRDMTRCVQRIAPTFNRTVVFATTDHSYHGHPEPLACPENVTRRSLSLYYYTSGTKFEDSSAPHDTIFQRRHETDW